MFSRNDGYSYSYKGNKKECDGELWFIRHTFTFKSRKNQTYVVWVDEIENFNLFMVKFFLKNHRESEKKFNILTGYQEAPSLIATCFNVMEELCKEYPYCSFGFIGAHSDGEDRNNTKRFKLYKRISTQIFTPSNYNHVSHDAISLYLILNRDYLLKNKEYIKELEVFLVKYYDKF